MKLEDLRKLAEARTKLRYEVVPNGCWEWTGYIAKSGYGQVSFAGKSHKAHRLSYLIHVGELTPGLEIDHLCRNRKCVNPEHLEQVTKAENIRRGESWSAVNFRKGECDNGHPFSPENTYTSPRGWRACKACRRVTYNKMYRRRRREILERQKNAKLEAIK